MFRMSDVHSRVHSRATATRSRVTCVGPGPEGSREAKIITVPSKLFN